MLAVHTVADRWCRLITLAGLSDGRRVRGFFSTARRHENKLAPSRSFWKTMRS